MRSLASSLHLAHSNGGVVVTTGVALQNQQCVSLTLLVISSSSSSGITPSLVSRHVAEVPAGRHVERSQPWPAGLRQFLVERPQPDLLVANVNLIPPVATQCILSNQCLL